MSYALLRLNSEPWCLSMLISCKSIFLVLLSTYHWIWRFRMWVWVLGLGLGFKVLAIRHMFSMQKRGPSLRVLVMICKVQMWHTHGVGETWRPSKRERINHKVKSISGSVELLNIQELLHYNWKFCIPPNVMWLCFMFCICSIRTQDFVVIIQLWNELWFTSPYTLLELRYLFMLISF